MKRISLPRSRRVNRQLSSRFHRRCDIGSPRWESVGFALEAVAEPTHIAKKLKGKVANDMAGVGESCGFFAASECHAVQQWLVLGRSLAHITCGSLELFTESLQNRRFACSTLRRLRNALLIPLLTASVLTLLDAQPANSNAVAFHEREGGKPITEPPAALRQLTAKLSGGLIGQSSKVAIEFVLILKNTGDQEVKIANPLDSLFLGFATLQNRAIPVPERLPKGVMNIGGDKTNVPFPAPIEVRQILQGTSVSYEKMEVMVIQPGEEVRITFDTQPVVIQKITAALASENGTSARSFKARARLVLLSRSSEIGGRSVESDWMSFSF